MKKNIAILVFAVYCAIFCTLLNILLPSIHVIYKQQFTKTIRIRNWRVRYNNIKKFQWCPMNLQKLEKNYPKPNCQGLLYDDDNFLTQETKNWVSPCRFTDRQMVRLSTNCSKFERSFPFWSTLLGQPSMDQTYSLAFVVIGATNAEQLVRMFQTVYHPDNLYCLTYDNKSATAFQQVVRNIASCYGENIILPDKFFDIHWAGYSILQSIMGCLEKLMMNKNFDWRYVQILSWNDLPLKTNAEMIEILKILNGSQDGELSRMDTERFRFYFRNGDFDQESSNKYNDEKPVAPGNLVVYKGSLAATMSREFVEFLFNNDVAKRFYEWSATSWAPEEQYWSTMIHNLHLQPPGGFPGTCLSYYDYDSFSKPFVSRYQTWEGKDCAGYLVSKSCVFGVGDLPRLISVYQLIAHKFYLQFQPAVYYCLSEWHFNKSYLSKNDRSFNLSFYHNLPSVRYHRLKNKDSFTC